MAVRILIADDSALFRQGLREALEANLEWEICGEAADGIEAIHKNRVLNPNLIIMDLSMRGMAGLEAARQILEEFPNVPILLLTLYLAPQLAEEARNTGIRGMVSKTAMHHLADAIRALLRGENFTAPLGVGKV